MGQSRPLFVYFCPFLITISIIQIEKSIDDVLGIWTCNRRMVGADEIMELWRPTKQDVFMYLKLWSFWCPIFHSGSATLSHSLSTHSFMSAMSDHEDFGLVNLHMQINKPITESPLLMSSYISHLTQLRCSNWNANFPLLQGQKKTVDVHHLIFQVKWWNN